MSVDELGDVRNRSIFLHFTLNFHLEIIEVILIAEQQFHELIHSRCLAVRQPELLFDFVPVRQSHSQGFDNIILSH
jgi:hypothetical protein